MEIIIILIWWMIGMSGFIFWWTKELDMDLNVFLFGCLVGLIGPITWIAGYFIHDNHGFAEKIVFKKRE